MWALILKAPNTSPKPFDRPLSLSPQPIRVLPETGLGPHAVFPTCSSKPFPSQPLIRFSPGSHQGATAEQNHEDDEGLKPVVLHNEEAGFPQDPPRLAKPVFNVDLAALESLDTTWHQRERQVRPRDVPTRPCPVLHLPGPTWRCPTT